MCHSTSCDNQHFILVSFVVPRGSNRAKIVFGKSEVCLLCLQPGKVFSRKMAKNNDNSNSNREVLKTEFRKLRRKRAAAGCESRKIMAHLSENPSECSVRPASNRTKFSVRFCGLRQCHVHFSIVICPSTVTRCDASRQTQAKLAIQTVVAAGRGCCVPPKTQHPRPFCRFAFRNPVVQASLVCSLTISSTSCQSAPRRRSSSSCLERKSRASILDWVSIGKPKFSFSFCLFGERRKVRRRRERKWRR